MVRRDRFNQNEVLQYNSDFYVTKNSPLSSPTNMNIPDMFGQSTYGGFNGNCLIGLNQIIFGGNNTAEY